MPNITMLDINELKKTKLKPGEVPFGKGNIRGVAAPESANNAAARDARCDARIHSSSQTIIVLTLATPPMASSTALITPPWMRL